jgi:uncharacterized protein
MKIGVISDTHGLLRREALDALKGSDLIIHAGDVDRPAILEKLEKVAPLVVVRGNVDRGTWAQKLPITETVVLEQGLIYIVHDLNDLDLDPKAADIQIVISGHSHKPSITKKQGVTYLNPGSAGPRRFDLPISLAKLHVRKNTIDVELIEILDKPK